MNRRHLDLGLGLLAAALLHSLVLAAAASVLRVHATDSKPQTDAPLELVMLDRATWRAQLEELQPARSAEPLEAPVIHSRAALPDWPELEVTRQDQSMSKLPVRTRRATLERDPQAQPRPRERLEATPLVPHEEQASKSTSQAMEQAPTTIEGSSALVIHRPELHYPSRPQRRGIEGTARVGIEVNSAGEVQRTWLIRSSGNRELDRAALRNLREWRFDAEELAKRPGASKFQSDVRFELR